jgi:hypothetical protein
MKSRNEIESGPGLPQTLADELDGIVTEFSNWVKQLGSKVQHMAAEPDVTQLETDLREGGRVILLKLMQRMLQSAISGQQESTRICPQCQGRRRHQGVRPRNLLSGFGSLTIQGVYWRCPYCGTCGHSADALMTSSMSQLMRGLVCLLGVSLASFDKAELVARRILGVEVDDDTIRRLCQKEGWEAVRQQDHPPEPVIEGEQLLGSCDGTSVNTRETGWRELKAFRFEHAGGRYGGAYLERVAQFVPQMVTATHRLKAGQAGRRIFLSDMADWITGAVARDLSDWHHIADYWHACQHFFLPGETLYGKDDPRAGKWSRYWCRRLRMYGAKVVDDRLYSIALHYTDLQHQRAVLDLAAFLRRHADRMDYPAYEQKGWTISSGPMESFCKQLGQRMKGPGMRWSVKNVSPMASLVSRWSLDAERCSLFGVVPCAN